MDQVKRLPDDDFSTKFNENRKKNYNSIKMRTKIPLSSGKAFNKIMDRKKLWKMK